MTQMDIFQERIQQQKLLWGKTPEYIVLSTEEFLQLKKESESFGMVEISAEEKEKAENEFIFNDQVATCFGIPVRVPEVNYKII